MNLMKCHDPDNENYCHYPSLSDKLCKRRKIRQRGKWCELWVAPDVRGDLVTPCSLLLAPCSLLLLAWINSKFETRRHETRHGNVKFKFCCFKIRFCCSKTKFCYSKIIFCYLTREIMRLKTKLCHWIMKLCYSKPNYATEWWILIYYASSCHSIFLSVNYASRMPAKSTNGKVG